MFDLQKEEQKLLELLRLFQVSDVTFGNERFDSEGMLFSFASTMGSEHPFVSKPSDSLDGATCFSFPNIHRRFRYQAHCAFV